MTDHEKAEERLLRRLLHHAERARQDPTPDSHVDEETLALFASGALEEAKRPLVIDHLAQCSTCRRSATLLLALNEEPAAEVRPSRALPRLHSRGLWIAVAASLLVAVGLVAWLPRQGRAVAENRAYDTARALLASGEFAQAKEHLESAARRGVRSDRLRSLEAQSVLKIRGPIALASAGRLTDFGVGIGGVVARSTPSGESRRQRQEALNLLAGAGSEETEVRLNRGYVLLALDRHQEALDEFGRLAADRPQLPLAWLGQGLAHFLLEDYPGAEKCFHQCLRLEPAQVAATMNLAMTLEEMGKLSEALPLWETLPVEQLSEDERNAVRAEIEELRRHVKPR